MGKFKILPFWERVKKSIRAHKISQKEFASYVGINYNTMKTWIYYDRVPDAYSACDIASALGVSMEYLTRGSEESAVKDHERETHQRKTTAAKIRKMARRIERDVSLIG